MGKKMAIQKARPTEYKGIRFRSKSEAIFARYLDLLMAEHGSIDSFRGRDGKILSGRGGFEYEPRTLVDGWNPDFLLWEVSVPHGDEPHFCWNVPTLNTSFLEYKPSRPTTTYIEEWARGVGRWNEMARRESFEHYARTDFRIFYGSPFSSCDRGVIHFEYDSHWDDADDWVEYFPDLMNYRFDLKQEAV